MGWWEDYSSGKKLIRGLIWYIEEQIESWVKSWAEWAASHADNYFSILNHDWSDVRNLINDKTGGFYSSINDFYSDLQNKLESSYSILNKSWYNVTSYVDDAISGFQSQINDLSSSASSLYTYAHTSLKNEINGLSQDIDNINDSLNIVTRTALATVNYIAIESERRWGILKKSWGDVTVLVNNNINSLKSDIITPISSNLTTLTNRVNTLVNTTIKNINTEITGVSTKLNKLTNDVVNPLKVDLTALTTIVNGFPSWITKTFDDISEDILEQLIKIFNASEDKSVRFLTALGIGAGEVITTILDTPKDMVAWIKNDIADVFEDILDRVFK
jgi:archaellum component FlaC